MIVNQALYYLLHLLYRINLALVGSEWSQTYPRFRWVMSILVDNCGFILAVMMANSGGAWDNAKKYIEAGHHGGKGSDCHKAAVVGDTVGDPFKDTSGPSLNILIKLCSTVSIVFCGVIVAFNLIGAIIG